jgi:hypothetical protein
VAEIFHPTSPELPLFGQFGQTVGQIQIGL